ncbi:uncharacterized protein DUF4389 [Humibacillus xanthopallidus]|uniref:Uncharacterized protein DUF4389 n=1 Tax=Humibacillus xanthopallidus TaxID=412689 RepID=A0A543PNP9_9MICO|nr:DUF4389 domain-containing protein [Humibacillus xanthopallidus]TQN45715.1 uncharacterized protein DUF4389 [Humibacillus xanthopallidus]
MTVPAAPGAASAPGAPVPTASHPAKRHLVALIIGCLLILPGLGLLLGGAAVAGAYAFGRDDAGFLSLSVPTLRSPAAAITVEDIIVENAPGVPSSVLDRLQLDLRMTAQPVTPGANLFLGVAPADALTSYLRGVAHDQVVGLSEPRSGSSRIAVLRTSPGAATAPAPTGETFWTTSVTGTGQQVLTWRVTGGRWALAVMNADGSAGVDVATTIGVRAGFLLPLALILFAIGLVVSGIAVALIVRGAGGSQPAPPSDAALAASEAEGGWAPHPRAVSPVSLDARLDEPLSRWLWLVKWFLAIPHFIVLGFLWIAFFVVSVIAFFAILFTGTYPRGLFDFNLGVLRWSWRVSYYCSDGGIGTDRYPPFSLDVEPDYPARLDIVYPGRLSRGLVLVKWWLLAIPHYIIVGLFVGGGGWAWSASHGEGAHLESYGWSLLGLLILVAGISLLFTGRYPRALFDLVIGLNRWVYRVIAYAALMTDAYPPFQLDEGGAEVPLPPPLAPPVQPVPPESQVPPDREPQNNQPQNNQPQDTGPRDTEPQDTAWDPDT